MRKLIHALLSLTMFVGAVNLAFAIVEGCLVASGRIQTGETIEYFERPAHPLGEIAASALLSLAVIGLTAFAQRGLKRDSGTGAKSDVA